MKRKSKRTEIISETSSVLYLKTADVGTHSAWCPQCNAVVAWLDPAALDVLKDKDGSRVAAIHKTPFAICSRSLLREIEMENSNE